MFTKLQLMLVAAALFVGCSTSTISNEEKKFNQLEVGMSVEQVKALLGEPSLREAREGKEVWYYSLGHGRDVEFKDKKVVSFGIPRKETDTTITGATPLKDIGEKCDADSACLSQYCLLSRCVGPRNCWRKVGQTCTADKDCCYSKCDFGVCKQSR